MNRLSKTLALSLLFLCAADEACCLWEECPLVTEAIKRELNDPRLLQSKENAYAYFAKGGISKEKISLIMDVIVMAKPRVCVEIGVFNGLSFIPMAAGLKYMNYGHAYAIDAWSNDEATKYMSDTDPNRAWWTTADMSRLMEIFRTALDHWGLAPFTTIIQRTSESAAPGIGPIDFLHLDGNYSTEVSIRDVELYLPKVKKGGLILFSNIFLCIDNAFPKKESFLLLLDQCEVLAEVDRGNAILLQKVR